MAKKAAVKKPTKAKDTAGNGKAPEPSKSVAIRAYLAAHKGAKAKEIIAALAGQGVTVNAGLVNNVKSNLKKKKGSKGKPGRKPGTKMTKPSANGSHSLFADVFALVELGGITAVEGAIDLIKRIKGSK